MVNEPEASAPGAMYQPTFHSGRLRFRLATMSTDPLDQQQSLAESSLGLLFETYDAAIKDGMTSPVVLLVDCEDEIGSQIARAWLGDDAVDDAVANNTDSDTTVYARAASWKKSRREVPETFDYLAPVFEQGPPEDGFLVVSITAGGASALTVPMNARE